VKTEPAAPHIGPTGLKVRMLQLAGSGYNVEGELVRTFTMRRYAPLAADHWLLEQVCPCCNQRFARGDSTTLVPLGPGRDRAECAKARKAMPAYDAHAIAVHWACATGEDWV
jgi:hypothetical protein